VLTALTREFCVCDRWFSSMPGPTWPNRFFMHAASSAGLDDSPSALRDLTAVLDGYSFSGGTLYDRLKASGRSWYIVEGDAFPQAMAIHGMIEHALEGRFLTHDELIERLQLGDLDASYVFIEPAYGHILGDGSNFKCGNSQHPLDDVTRGEALLKRVYEALRNSSLWDTSVLLITYDEHGGFYDHVAPPAAPAPGDSWLDPGNNTHGFTFEQLGVRVATLVVSPWVDRGVIDHRVHDHAAISATVDQLFGTGRMTLRDRSDEGLAGLFTRASPRNDAPAVLPSPADSGLHDCEDSLLHRIAGDLLSLPAELFARPVETALNGFVHVAAMRDMHLAAVSRGKKADAARSADSDRLASSLQRAFTSKYEAAHYLRDVALRYQAFREGGSG
jgi:phospholipase C